MVSRRHLLRIGGGFLAGLALPASWALAAEDVVEIRMNGNADGSEVWYDPIGVLVRPGQTIRWINLDPGNSHTATAYHPRNFDHPLRIPEAVQPWDSDYLLPNERFEVRLTAEGVYDYFCVPHEVAGMVGRIIVGRPAGPGMRPFETSGIDAGGVPEAAQRAFPSVDAILRTGVVRRI